MKIKNLTYTILFLAVIVGLYLFFGKRNFPPTSPTIPMPPITKIESSSTSESALVYFFDYLNNKDYVSASNLFYLSSQEKENFIKMIPSESSDSFVNLPMDRLLQEYCQIMPTCLPVDVIENTEISPTESKFTVQHFRANRSIFQAPGYMGSAPRDTFEYTVKKINGQFKVTTPPAYLQ